MSGATQKSIHVSEEERRIVCRVLREALHGEAVFVFGSRARGDHRRASDLDIAVLASHPLSITTQSQLEFGFSESDLPFKVDVVDLRTVDPSFREIIESEAIPLEYTSP
jgi:hypothetical protein